jgi:hypothetical protein
MGTGQLLAVPSLSLCGGTTIDLSLVSSSLIELLSFDQFTCLLVGPGPLVGAVEGLGFLMARHPA